MAIDSNIEWQSVLVLIVDDRLLEPLVIVVTAIACHLDLDEEVLCVGLARVGADDQRLVSGTLSKMATTDMGPPLHSLIITGNTHPLEHDMLKLFSSPV